MNGHKTIFALILLIIGWVLAVAKLGSKAFIPATVLFILGWIFAMMSFELEKVK